MTKKELFLRIRNACDTDEQYLYELLMFRGFLLEEKADGVHISDNSHYEDKNFLCEILEGFGYLANNKIILEGKIDFQKVENLFCSSARVSYPIDQQEVSWSCFKHRIHGTKVAVKELEAFIARYVKAISACGVLTRGSCDGNHSGSKKLYLQLDGTSSAIWHKIICENVLKDKFNILWQWNNATPKVGFNTTNQFDTYLEINNAAKYLYENRIILREIKQKSFDGMSCRFLRHQCFDRVSSEFEEAAKILINQYFYQR